jgi:DNA-binding NarL/FixJ family response regulator
MAEARSGTVTTVLIADDHQLFSEGLEALIERWPDFRVVGSAEDGAEAVEKARELRPGLVLMDIRMPGIGGLEATRLITSADPSVRVVMLTMSNLGGDVLQALRNGAHGYLGKDEPVERLHGFLQGVMRGESVLSGPIAAKVLGEFAGHPAPTGAAQPSGRDAALTRRERDVLQLVVDGLSNEEIAHKLYLSEATVKKHLGRVMAKWHMKNRVQLAVHGVRQGIVD